MSYLALYRKFRPETFEQVRGQDAVVTTLKNQIQGNRIGHAYLFCGTRGTGKTTVAKIFAKAVNCQNPQEGSPCGTCDMCRGIKEQTLMNVVEIDAASNNGVDNIREIIEEVQYSPPEGKYKVYIIDEVHMLSTGAFNALLKTLEEPPAYVIFILATTEAHKIPVTILSRCQRYDFKRISVDTIETHLKELLKEEGVVAQEKAVGYLARMADGSMRDALSLLDQCIGFYLGQELTYEKVLKVLGAVDTEVYHDLLEEIRKEDVTKVLALLGEMISGGVALERMVGDFIWYLRNILMLRASGGDGESIEVAEDKIPAMKEQADAIKEPDLIRYIRILSDCLQKLRYSAQKRVTAELAFLELMHPEMEEDLSGLQARIRKLEDRMEGEPVGNRSVNSQGEASQEEGRKEIPPEKKPEAPLPAAVPEEIQQVASKWQQLVKEAGGLNSSLLKEATPSVNESGGLLLVYGDPMTAELVSKPQKLQEITQYMENRIQRKITIQVKLAEAKEEQDRYPDITRIAAKVPVERVEE